MREFSEAGMLGVMAPGSAGGLDMGLMAAGVIATEVGRALAPEPVVPVVALAIADQFKRGEMLCADVSTLKSGSPRPNSGSRS